MRIFMAAALAATLFAGQVFADGHRTPAPEGAKVYIVAPADGSTVTNPATVVFGLEGMGIAPAGTEADNTGHHHLLINTAIDSLDVDAALPATDQIVHFGGGQTQVTKELPAGTHTLQLLLGDWSHVPHDPPIASEIITVTVE
jgi:hypothetical protein